MRPRDATLENCFSQMCVLCTLMHGICMHNVCKNKRQIPWRTITWSELGKQSIQAKKVYFNHKYEDEHVVSYWAFKVGPMLLEFTSTDVE